MLPCHNSFRYPAKLSWHWYDVARDSKHDLYSYSDRYVSSPAHDYSKIADIRKQPHVPVDELYYCCRRLLRFPITTGLGDYMVLPPQYLERLYASACGEILGYRMCHALRHELSVLLSLAAEDGPLPQPEAFPVLLLTPVFSRMTSTSRTSSLPTKDGGYMPGFCREAEVPITEMWSEVSIDQ